MSKDTAKNSVRLPRIGERVEVHTEDRGDAGLKVIVGTKAVVTKVEFDEKYQDYTFEVEVVGEHGREWVENGCWGIIAEYGNAFSDYYEGRTTTEAFWSVFRSLETDHSPMQSGG